MSVKRFHSEHPDLDEIVTVTRDDEGVYSARMQVTAEAFREHNADVLELGDHELVGVEIVHVDENTTNVTFFSEHQDVIQSCINFIADTFVTYDDSMQDALRKIDLSAA